MITNLMNTPVITALGWTLVHSLWIALVFALITRLFFVKVNAERALLRYRISLGSMLGILLVTIGIFVRYYTSFEAPEVALGPEISMQTNETVFLDWEQVAPPEAASKWSWSQLAIQLEYYFPVLVLLWLLGASFMGIRLAGSWWYLHQMGTQGLQTPDTEWTQGFHHLCTKMGVRRPVRLYWSERVQEPVTLKHIKPIVLFPLGLVTQLSPEQIEIVLLHELAHIKRWDYLVNWVQSLLELLFFYHPAVWWLSAQVRTAREHCCDDLVLQANTQQRMLYAQTLTQLSVYSLNFKSKLAMSYSENNHQSFTFRVKRLFGQAEPSRMGQKPILSGLLVLLFMVLILLNSSNLFAEEPALETTEEFLMSLLDPEIRNLVLDEEELVLDTIPVANQRDNPNKEKAIFIDGEFQGYGTIAGGFPKDFIQMREITDPKEAIDAYGPRAQYGAFDFITKKSIDKGVFTTDGATTYDYSQREQFPIYDIIPKGDSLPAYFLDNKRVQDKDLDVMFNLPPAQISKVHILNNPIVYGIRYPEGAVMIYTRAYVAQQAGESVEPDVLVEGSRTLFGVKPLIILDGKRIGFGKEKLEDIDSVKIASVNVYKDEKALEKFGSEAQNGVIEVFTKDFVTKQALEAPSINVDPLIIIDGVREGFGKEKLEALEPAQIATVTVLKGESATEKYGPEARDGVIEVQTKIADASQGKVAKEEPAAKVIVRGVRSKEEQQPLFVVDSVIVGRSATDEEFQKLDPNDIESINVLKGESAIKKYGDAGMDGVVEINTKNKRPTSTSMKMGKDLERSVFKFGPKGKLQKMDPLVVLNDEKVVGRASKVGSKFKEGEMDMIRFSGPSPELIFRYGKEAEEGVVFVTSDLAAQATKEQGLDNSMVYINGEKRGFWKEVKETLDKTQIASVDIYGKEVLPAEYADSPHDIVLVTLKGPEESKDDRSVELSFQGKSKIDRPGEKPVEIDGDFTMTMKKLQPAKTSGKDKITRISTEGGISVKAFLHENAQHPLLILDGKVVAPNAPAIQNLAPTAVKEVILIKGGPALLPYGEAAKYGVMRIYTDAGITKEQGQSNSIKISEQSFEDYQFMAGPKGQEKLVDPLVLLNGKVVGPFSEVAPQLNLSADDIEKVLFTGLVEEALIQQYGDPARQGIVQVFTKQVNTRPNQPIVERQVQVFPNPFDQSTRINFNLAAAARVKVSIFNAQGQLIQTLVDGQLPAGPQQFDWDSYDAPLGTYTVVVESGDWRNTKTIVKQ